jgi:hypothetical protein
LCCTWRWERKGREREWELGFSHERLRSDFVLPKWADNRPSGWTAGIGWQRLGPNTAQVGEGARPLSRPRPRLRPRRGGALHAGLGLGLLSLLAAGKRKASAGLVSLAGPRASDCSLGCAKGSWVAGLI